VLLGLLLGTAPALSAMESKPPVIGDPVCSENHPGSKRRIPHYLCLSIKVAHYLLGQYHVVFTQGLRPRCAQGR
jgi:hypothetical protein